MKKILIILLIILTIMGCDGVVPNPDPIPDPNPNSVEYRGFFVGITDYQSYICIYDLISPAKNTIKLKELFEKCKFGEGKSTFLSINTLTDHNATKENILNGILEQFSEADENDVSYFYFMGHGTTLINDPAIVPTDFKITIPSSYITVHELEEILSQIQGTKVVLLETCHAGNFIGKSSIDNFDNAVIDVFSQKPVGLLTKENYQVLTSSAGAEYSWDSSLGSLFCRYFIKGTKPETLYADKNSDGIADLTEILDYIRLSVTKQTAQSYPEGSIFPIVQY
ncbi:MAG: caspase family protein [Eubacteriales bacterium]